MQLKKTPLLPNIDNLLGRKVFEVAAICHIENKALLKLLRKGAPKKAKIVTLLTVVTQEHLNVISNKIANSYPSHDYNKDEQTTLEDHSSGFLSFLIGKSILEVALLCDQPCKKIIDVLANKKIKVKPTSALSETHLSLIKGFLENSLELKSRNERKRNVENIQMVKKNKDQPSHGLPGNYVKLIYSTPKQ